MGQSAFVIEACEPRRLFASVGPAQLVAQINTTTLSSSPGGYVDMNGVAYFTARTEAAGYELWRSDGTAAGTWQVKELTPGPMDSELLSFLVVGDTLYFFREIDGTTDLWRSDGTTAGTTLIANLPIVHAGGMTMAQGILYFAADDVSGAGTGRELYCSDGTAAGTHLLKDIAPTFDGDPQDFVLYHDTLYFSAEDDVRGWQIWTSDGTTAGTVPVTNINTGPGRWGFRANSFTLYHDQLYFAATQDNDATYNVWKTDGTAAGTQLAIFTNPNANTPMPGGFTVSGDKLFFTAEDSTAGYELFVSDGTQAGTHLVKDVKVGSYDTEEGYLVDNDGVLFFAVINAYGDINGIWRSDGTEAGTYRISGDMIFDAVSPLTVLNGKIYCLVEDTTLSSPVRQVCVADIASCTAVLLTNTVSSRNDPSNLARIGDSMFFTQYSGQYGNEPWRTDGTPAGTVMIADINASVPTGGSAPELLTASGQYLFFRATVSSLTGREIYRTDGTAAGTILLADCYPGTNSGDPTSLTDVNGTLYFAAATASSTVRLWRSDGTPGGTSVVTTALKSPTNLLNVDGTLYFLATNGSGYGIYKISEAGPVLVSSLGSSVPNVSDLANMVRLNSVLYFRLGSTSGLELFKYPLDGSAAPSVVKDINPGSASSSPDKFTVIGSTLYFVATNGTSGVELWKTDGTSAGTSMVADINPGSLSSTPSFLTNLNGTLLFGATTAAAGSEIWRSDGTAAGTYMITQIAPGATTSLIRNITAMGGFALFEANNQSLVHNELWRTDGTAVGTYMVRDIYPSNSSNPQQFINVGGRLYFQARDPSLGVELWTSDGTRDGTVMVSDIVPGSGGSTPQNFAVSNGNLFFAGAGVGFGLELWKVPLDVAFVAARGELIVNGTSASDHFVLSAGATDLTVQRGASSVSFPLSSFSSIVVSGLAGDDILDVNSSLAAALTFDGNEGQNVLNLTAGANAIASDIGAAGASVDVHVDAAATVTFDVSQHINNLSISGGAILPAGGGKLLVMRDLAVTGGGVLQVNDNAVAIDYAGASPIGGWNGAKYTGITGLIAAGRNGGTWDGSGIVTSMSAAIAPNSLTTLAVAEVADVLSISGSQTALWNGQTVDATTVIVKYTYTGDANLDGVVSGDDYFQIDSAFPQSLHGWLNGDFNYDGVITGDDYFLIDSTFPAQGLPL